jgi:periplasmic protein TonB
MRLAWFGSIAAHAALAGGLLWLATDRPPVAQIGSIGAVTVSLVDGPAESPGAGAPASAAPSRTPPRVEPPQVTAARHDSSPIQPGRTETVVQPVPYAPTEASSGPVSAPSMPEVAATDDAVGGVSTKPGETGDAGSVAAASANGAAAGETDPWPAYYAAVQAAMQRVQQYPFSARLAGLEDRVKVSFRITSNGSAEQIHLIEFSRFPVLNDAALDTVRRAARFPAPPLRDRQSGVRVTVPLEFTLHHQKEASPH